jgi:chromosome partitioning protein
VLVNQTPIEETICNVYEGFDVIPSNLGLTRVEVPLSQKTRREESFKKALESIKKEYDFILIDTNPTISNLNMNALFAADHVNIVCETQPFSLSGLGILVEELEKMYRDLGREFKFIVVPNKYESKTATAQEVLGILRKDYKDNIAQTVIRKCEDFNISSKLRLPVCCFVRKDSSALEDMIDFIYEFINMSSKPIK